MDSSDSSQPQLRTKEVKKQSWNAKLAVGFAGLFIKNYKDTGSSIVRRKYGYLGSCYGLVTNIFLFVAKIICSFIFALGTLRADAINNASDIGMCVLALICVFIASRPASKEHPYGSARFEYIGSLCIAILIIVIAGSQIIDTIGDLIAQKGLSSDVIPYTEAGFYVPFAVMVLSFFVKLSQYFLLTGLAKESNSMTLMATGKDARNDSMVSGMIAVSLLLSYPLKFDIDPITAIGVSLLVCLSGLGIIKEASSAIMGTLPPKSVVDDFAKRVEAYPVILSIHDLEMHTYGSSSIHAYVHAEVDASIPILIIRDDIDHIEKEVERQTGIRTVIHIDPVKVGDLETDRYKEYVSEAAEEVDPDIAVNDFRVLTNPDNPHRKLLIMDLVLPFDLLAKDKEVIEKIKETVKSFTSDQLTFSIDIDSRASDLLLMLKDEEKSSSEL